MTSTSSTLEAQLKPREIIDALRYSRGDEALDELLEARLPLEVDLDFLKPLVTEDDVKNLHRLHVDTSAERDASQKSIQSTMNRVKSHGDLLGDKADEYREAAHAELDTFLRLQDEVSSIRSAMNTLRDVLEFRRRNS